jgi:hypothetical protein
MHQALVAAGVGIGFLPRLALHPIHPGRSVKLVAEAPRRRILAIALTGARNSATEVFLGLSRISLPRIQQCRGLLGSSFQAVPTRTRSRIRDVDPGQQVTPEVAGSSPVAPVKTACKSACFVADSGAIDRQLPKPVTRSARTRLPDAGRRRTSLQIDMFCVRTRDQSLRSSRADPASGHRHP